MIRDRSSSNQTSDQQKLLVAFKERKFHEFNNLIKYRNIDVDHFYGEPDNGTLLDLVCRSKGNGRYASILLLNGASIWLKNKVTGKCALDEAIANRDDNTMKQLGAALNQRITTSGDQLAHSHMQTAVEKNDVEVMKFIAKNLPQNPEYYNPNGPHMALLRGSIEAAKVFIECFDIDLEFQWDSHGCAHSCREIILQIYPQLEPELPVVKEIDKLRNILCSYLHSGLTELFLNRLSDEIVTNTLNDSFKGIHDKTYLHLACEYNQINVVYALLKRKVFLNKLAREPSDPRKAATPVMMSAFKGHYEITKELVRRPEVKLQIEGIGSILHSVIRGKSMQTNPEGNHRSILKLLLEPTFLAANKHRLNIDHLDNDNLTALHYAIAFENEFAISSLIHAGANLYLRDPEGKLPLTSIPAKILEKCFDDCIHYVNPKENECYPPKFEIRFNYNIFIRSDQTIAPINYEMQFWDSIEQERALRQLFNHPLSKSFLHVKWCLVRRYYFLNLIFYLSFCLVLSSYIFKTKECPQSSSRFNTSRPTEHVAYSILCQASYLPLITLILYIGLILIEICKFFVLIRSYSLIENCLKMAIIIAIGIYFANETNTKLAATVMLMSWIEFVFFLGRLPSLSIYIEMFKTVALNFAKFFILYSILVASFASSFFILFHDKTNTNESKNSDPNSINSWLYLTVSLVKSIIMMIGEFDASGLPLGSNFNYRYVFFTFFIFLVTIVLHNLLNGLAVSDTRAIMVDSEVVALVSRAKQISKLERLFVSSPFQYFHSCLSNFFNRRNITRFELGCLFICNKIFGPNLSLSDRMNREGIGEDVMVFVRPSKNNKITTSFSSDKYIGQLPSAIVKQAKEIIEKRNQSKSIENANADQNTKCKCVDELIRQFGELKREIDFKNSERDEKWLRCAEEIMKRIELVEQMFVKSTSNVRRSEVCELQ